LDDRFAPREPGYTTTRQIYTAAATRQTPAETPWLYWLQLPQVARDDATSAAFQRLAYETAGWLPMRILDADDPSVAAIPPESWVLVRPDRLGVAEAPLRNRIEQLARKRRWHVIGDTRSGLRGARYQLDLDALTRAEPPVATDALFAALGRWREQEGEL